MEQRTAVVVIDDLFFLAKVQTTLRHLSLAAKVLTTRTALQDYLRSAAAPAMVVVDLTLRADDAVAMINTIRATDGGRTVPILAFGAHVAVDVRQHALQAGATQVVTKSEFSKHLPALLQHLAAQG
jgi:CheY-like chemotaxis protein